MHNDINVGSREPVLWFEFSSLSSRPLLLLGLAVFSISLNGCSTLNLWGRTPSCNIQTYIDAHLVDYLKSRYHRDQLIRLAIFPFDVQETFAPAGNDSLNFGRDLAKSFQLELSATGELGIVELFNRDRWPGKREEFFVGNYQALELARNAGYDVAVVGYLEEIKNATDMVLYVKAIDTANNVTLWSSKTVVSSDQREFRRTLAAVGLTTDRPELFDFSERTELMVKCTVETMVNPPAE